jgi:hypothetical protein
MYVIIFRNLEKGGGILGKAGAAVSGTGMKEF